MASVPAPSLATSAPTPSAATTSTSSALAPTASSAVALPASGVAPSSRPDGSINYFEIPPGSESLFRVREEAKVSPDSSEYHALVDGFVEVGENETSTTVRTFARKAAPKQLFTLPAALSYSDMEADPAGERVAVIVGKELTARVRDGGSYDDGDLYVWSKQSGLRRLLAARTERAPQKGFLRWSLDGKWLGFAVLERPCGKARRCERGVVVDATTGAVKYLTPPQLGSGQLTFNAEHAFMCGSLFTTLDDELDDGIGISGIGVPRVERTADEKRDGCRWYEMSLATGIVTRGAPPVFTSPDGQYRIRKEGNELAVMPSGDATPYRIHIAEAVTPPVFFDPHTLELDGFAFDLATRTSRALAPDGFRFMLLSHDRQTALFQRQSDDKKRREIFVAERR